MAVMTIARASEHGIAAPNCVTRAGKAPWWRQAWRGEPRWFFGARQGDPSWVRASRATGGRASSVKSVEATGSRLPRSARAIGGVSRPHEEVASWEQSPRPSAGGPERSVGDPQRKPRDSLCGGPGRSSDGPRLSKTTQAKAKRESKGKKARSVPPSSLWTKAARKERGATLPHRCMESGVLLGEEGRCQDLPREGR